MLSFVRSPEVLEEFECCHVAVWTRWCFPSPPAVCPPRTQATDKSHRIIKVPKDLLLSWSSTLNLTLPQSSCTELSSASLLPSPAGLERMPCLAHWCWTNQSVQSQGQFPGVGPLACPAPWIAAACLIHLQIQARAMCCTPVTVWHNSLSYWCDR